MLDGFARTIANAIYLVPAKINKFKQQHPETQVFIADAAKARKVPADGEAQYEMGWANARRNILILTTNGLFCGDWTIPLSTIQEATLINYSGGSILKVSTSDGLHYQFGLQRNPEWEEQKVLPLKIQKGVLKFSKTSLILRLILLVWLIYIIVQEFMLNGLNFWVVLYLGLLIWIVIPLLRLLRNPRAR